MPIRLKKLMEQRARIAMLARSGVVAVAVLLYA